MKRGDDVGGELRALVERALGRAHRPQDELRAAGGRVLLEALAHELGGPERRTAGARGSVYASGRDEGRRQGAGGGGIRVEAVVEENSEVISRNLAFRFGGERLRLVHTEP